MIPARSKPVIALDGPAGAGKSSVAARLAERLGYQRIETGALYRALAYRCIQERSNPSDAAVMEALARRVSIRLAYDTSTRPPLTRVWVDDEECTTFIRDEAVGRAASLLSQHGGVRQALTAMQRQMGAKGGVIMEGRDIATVIFPDAEFKFFITADPRIRAERRMRELTQMGYDVDVETVFFEMIQRDQQDTHRASAPLVRSDDAEIIDTTAMTIDEVVDRIIHRVQSSSDSTRGEHP